MQLEAEGGDGIKGAEERTGIREPFCALAMVVGVPCTHAPQFIRLCTKHGCSLLHMSYILVNREEWGKICVRKIAFLHKVGT